MKVLHTSDWHLGRTFHQASLFTAHQGFLDWLVDYVRNQGIDVVLLSGDVYDRAFPPAESIAQFEKALVKLTDHAQVIITPGNHDCATRLGFGQHFYRDNLIVRTRLEDIGQAVELKDKAGVLQALVYPLPYLHPDRYRVDLVDDIGLAQASANSDAPATVLERSHQAVTAGALRRIYKDLLTRPEAGRVPALVMAHTFVVGGTPSDSERDIHVGGIDYVSADIFESLGMGPESPSAQDLGLAYVALGHLHGPQDITTKSGLLMRYSGSPIAFSFSETAAKSVTVLDITDGQITGVQSVATPVERQIAVIETTMAQLESGLFDQDRDKWVCITITDDIRPDQMVARIRRHFNHALVMRHASRLHLPQRSWGQNKVKRASVEEVVLDFIKYVSASPATPKEVDCLRNAIDNLQSQRNGK